MFGLRKKIEAKPSQVGYRNLLSRLPENINITIDDDVTGTENVQKEPSIAKLMSRLWKMQQPDCEQYRVFDLAIEYDSTFCNLYGNTKESAEQEIQNVLWETAKLFDVPGLCLEMNVPVINGSCDGTNEETDPLINTVKLTDRQARLQDFREFFNAQYSGMIGTIISGAYMFTAVGMDDGYIGNAFTNVTCRPSFSYGIVVFNEPDITPPHHILLAHELGHTIGANHFDGLDQYIMNTRMKQGCNGFHPTSIQAMRNELDRGCLALSSAPALPPSNDDYYIPIMENSVPTGGIAAGGGLAALLTLLGLLIFFRIRKKRNEEDVSIDDYDDIDDVRVEKYREDAESLESMEKVFVISAVQYEEKDENDKNNDNEKHLGTLNADYGVKTDIK